jgi:hypothetical protein
MSTGSSFSFTIAAGQTSYLDGYTGTCVRTGVTNGNGEKVFKYVVSATGKVTFTATSGKKLRLYRLDDVCQATACQMMGFGSVYESVTYMTEPGEVIYVSVENTDALAASGTMTVVFTAPL